MHMASSLIAVIGEESLFRRMFGNFTDQELAILCFVGKTWKTSAYKIRDGFARNAEAYRREAYRRSRENRMIVANLLREEQERPRLTKEQKRLNIDKCKCLESIIGDMFSDDETVAMCIERLAHDGGRLTVIQGRLDTLASFGYPDLLEETKSDLRNLLQNPEFNDGNFYVRKRTREEITTAFERRSRGNNHWH